MKENLAQLTIPGYGKIQAPPGIPTGGAGTLSSAIAVGLQIFLIVVIIASLLYIVWAGTNWIRSSGDPQKIEAARTQIVYAIIGLLVALLSFGIMTFFGSIFNVKFV